MRQPCTRRAFIAALALTTAIASGTRVSAQDKAPTPRVRRIGFITGSGLPEIVEALHDELRTLGYTEGRDLIIEQRLARPNAFAETSAQLEELARMDLELIVAGALPFALEIRSVNPKMPMVIATAPGLVSNGFAQSLEKPGGIYTGMDELPGGVTERRVTLLRAAAPGIRRVALLSTTPGKGGHQTQVADAERAAKALGISVTPYRASSIEQLRSALDAISADRMEGVVNFQGGLSLANRKLIVDHLNEYRIPAIYQATLFAEAGGLMAWAPDIVQQHRIAARYVDKILKGARPGDLPIVHPERYFLTIHAGTAQKIRLQLPPDLLKQAARVLT
jgi:ABC-type uncharacterized transport system substrate-binding protein